GSLPTSREVLMTSRAGGRKNCNLVITIFTPAFLLFYLTPANSRADASGSLYVRFLRLAL
ncbi:hypothetical protein, partial [Clostridium sp. D5]|uniref:hypothetical protein n=1 Tax=Clostridium sp. D5 TaxID=556261 RepID=UPI001A97FEE0